MADYFAPPSSPRLPLSEETARSLRRRVAELLPLWQEARDLARLTAHYYDRGYYRNEKYTV